MRHENSDIGPGGEQPWPSPINERGWIDPAGGHWRMRGHELGPRDTRRLVKREGLRVLHVYGPQPREVSGSELDGLLERLSEFFAGEAPPTSEFRLGDFRNAKHQVMLVVEESC